MKSIMYAAIAAGIAMLATSGIVAFATASPNADAPVEMTEAERELVEHLDTVVDRHLQETKARLIANR